MQSVFTETYRLYIEAFKTARFKVFLNDTQVLDNHAQFDGTIPANAYFASNDIWLTQGALVSLRIEYSESLGDSKLRLFWESDSQPFALVASDYLYNTLYSQTTPFSFVVLPVATNETTTTIQNHA